MRYMLIFSALLLSSVSSAAWADVDPALVAAAKTDIETAPSWAVIDSTKVSAAANGDADAQSAVGSFYSNTEREAIAIKWFRLAADQGNAESQFKLAMAYDQGRGISANKIEAIRLYKLAVAQGYSDAQLMLASKYAQGMDVEQDFAQAAKLYQLAADQGDVFAINELGKMYVTGRGVAKSTDQAIQLYKVAAQHDFHPSQIALAFLYDEKHSNGDVSADYLLKAYAWLRLAISTEPGNENESDKKFAEITARMTSTQLSAGQAMVAHCFPDPENKVYQFGCTQDQPF